MRLTVSKYLARLTDRANQYVLRGDPLGDTSITAGTSYPALRHFVQLNIDPENGARPSGMQEGLWAESEASGWRKVASKQVGVVADRIRWVGGASNEAVKKGRVSSELVKEGGVSRRMGGLSIPGQTERTSRQEPGAMSRNGRPPADAECTNGPVTRPFIDPVVRGEGDNPKWCRHPNWVLWLGPGQHTAQPCWLEAAPLYIWQDDSEMKNRPTPNNSTRIALYRTPGPCPSDRRSAPVNVLPVRTPCSPSRTVCLCLATASPGREVRRHLPSVGDTHGCGGQ